MSYHHLVHHHRRRRHSSVTRTAVALLLLAGAVWAYWQLAVGLAVMVAIFGTVIYLGKRAERKQLPPPVPVAPAPRPGVSKAMLHEIHDGVPCDICGT